MDKAGLVLAIPADFDLQDGVNTVASILGVAGDLHLASLRLKSAGVAREQLIRRGDILRDLGHKHDIAVLIDDHANIAKEIGLDGVHLTDPDPKLLRAAKKTLGSDAIIGVFAGASKHDGMVAGEIGCDYISFGPIQFRGFEEEIAAPEIFEWWSEMIELPIVAEGGIDEERLATIKDHVDFITLGEEVFGNPSPLERFKRLCSIL